MNVIQKSEAIKNGLRKGFQDGRSKMAKRKCYGYSNGILLVTAWGKLLPGWSSDEIHFQERRLDRLDYLRHQIRKKSGKGT